MEKSNDESEAWVRMDLIDRLQYETRLRAWRLESNKTPTFGFDWTSFLHKYKHEKYKYEKYKYKYKHEKYKYNHLSCNQTESLESNKTPSLDLIERLQHSLHKYKHKTYKYNN